VTARPPHERGLGVVFERVAGGQFLLGLVAEPSPAPLAVGSQVMLALPPDAFLLL
jgi:hypothetical protein